MEAKNDDDAAPPEAIEAKPAPLAKSLRLVAKHFADRRAELGEAAADYDGIEYGAFIADNADEFEDYEGCGDGTGNSHDMKELHDEFLELFSADVEKAVADTDATLEEFLVDVQAARRDGLTDRWAALEMATGVACRVVIAVLDARREAAQLLMPIGGTIGNIPNHAYGGSCRPVDDGSFVNGAVLDMRTEGPHVTNWQVWFCEATWAALDINEFATVMKEAAKRQRLAMDRKRALRRFARGAKQGAK